MTKPYPKDSEKLGKVDDQPANSAFGKIDAAKPRRSLPRTRKPGWHPDKQNDQGSVFTVYPEEALLGIGNKFEPFAPFFEETSSAPNAQWLGRVLEPPANPSNLDFTSYLWAIANAVRRYNADLYFLRRLHFIENGEPIAGDLPKRNPNGDKDDPASGKPIPDPKADPGAFAAFVGDACEKFNDSVDQLNNLLNSGTPPTGLAFPFTNTIADMVEVNGYIVSMRIISPEPVTEKLTIQQIGGSSSSFVYIPSPFSSSYP